MNTMIKKNISIVFTLVFIIVACNSNTNNTLKKIPSDIAYMQTMFYNTHNVITSYDTQFFYVHSNGIPVNKEMMVGITHWAQEVPLPQNYTEDNAWAIPLFPHIAKTPLSLRDNLLDSAIGVAIDGVPIYNPLNKQGEDVSLQGALDTWGGHAGKEDNYHYHKAPIHLVAFSHNGPIGYALDGIPIYGTKERDGSPHNPLDKNHGHRDMVDGYHYHSTEEYPYMIGNMVGEITLESRPKHPKKERGYETNNAPIVTQTISSTIIPQPKIAPIRHALPLLPDILIDTFEVIDESSYRITYSITTEPPDKNGYYNFYQLLYSWDTLKENYTFQYYKNTYIRYTKTYTPHIPALVYTD